MIFCSAQYMRFTTLCFLCCTINLVSIYKVDKSARLTPWNNYELYRKGVKRAETIRGAIQDRSSSSGIGGSSSIVEDCQTQAQLGHDLPPNERVARFEKTPCGALWNGGTLEKGTLNDNPRIIHVVIAYCSYPLWWLDDYFGPSLLANHTVTITIFSKCGNDDKVHQYFKNQTHMIPYNVRSLPNVGGCDHTYAHFVHNIENYGRASKADYVLFLKDTEPSNDALDIPGTYRSPEDMLRIASVRGFGCGVQTNRLKYQKVGEAGPRGHAMMSAFHNTHALTRYKLKNGYERSSVRHGVLNGTESPEEAVEFSSKYSKMRNWLSTAMSYHFPAPEKDTDVPLTQVCYGGLFAVSREKIQSHSKDFYQRLEGSLTRGNNIEEGHYVERTWAGVWSPPPTPEERQAMLTFGIGIVRNKGGIFGALARHANT